MADPADFFVLVPDAFGELIVCPLDQVVAKVVDYDGDNREELCEDIFNDAGIDQIGRTRHTSAGSPVFILNPEKIERVRVFNLTGNSIAYWSTAVD